MRRIEFRERQLALIRKIMEMMVKENFTVEEAEALPEALSEELKKNSERLEKEKPFAVFSGN